MKDKVFKVLKNWVLAFIYPRPIVGLVYLPRYFIHLARYVGVKAEERLPFVDMQPCLGDWTTHTPFDAHYFYQGAWLARRVAAVKCEKHVDIGSSVLTIGVLSAHVETLFIDFRPLDVKLPGLTSQAGNILDLQFKDGSVPSLSCLHVIEHIGLGRYGDPIDSEGSKKAAAELQRVTRPGGNLYLALPVGRERVCFNAHRVHEPDSVIKMFPNMTLQEFSYVDDAGQFHENARVADASALEYGCGLFIFEKL